MIERALEYLQRKSLDGYELYVSQSSLFDVDSKDAKVDHFEVSHSWGMAIRVLNRQRIGFSYITSPYPSLLQATIDDAIVGAAATAPDPCLDVAPAFENGPSSLAIFDETLGDVTEETKIEKAKELEEAARSVDPVRIKKVRKASYHEILSRKTLINSNGLRFSYAATFVSVSVTVVAETSEESEVGWDFDYSHFVNDLDVKSVGRSAGKKALEKLGGRRIPSGVYPVLLQNRVASEFLSPLTHSFLAEQVHKGKSPLKGRRGEIFFSPLLSIVDDGLLPRGVSTSPVDGEGMPRRRTSLVIGGEIRGYLYDRCWANRENMSPVGPRVESTGNSRRLSVNSPPVLGISNFFIDRGKFSPRALMQALDRGVMIEEVMGLHTVDPISGDFSLGCSGYWVERGEKVYPVKSIAVAGNLFDLFRDVIAVGEDLRFLGGVGSPSLLIKNLEISGHD
jgi:PmbA protein